VEKIGTDGLPVMVNSQIKLSSHIKALLEIADNKVELVEIIFSRTSPTTWSGSRAKILENRSKAFAELLNHPSYEVRDLVKAKLVLFEEAIQREKAERAERDSEREQRFE
jgi:hypothetical protein